MPGDARFLPVGQIARGLTTAGAINERTEDNLEHLWKARGLALHEGQDEDTDVPRAIDSGLMILDTLSALESPDRSADPSPTAPVAAP